MISVIKLILDLVKAIMSENYNENLQSIRFIPS